MSDDLRLYGGWQPGVRNAPDLATTRARLRELALAAGEVMTLLDDKGPSIVPHLIDTDANAGQRLRDLAAAALALLADTPSVEPHTHEFRTEERFLVDRYYEVQACKCGQVEPVSGPSVEPRQATPAETDIRHRHRVDHTVKGMSWCPEDQAPQPCDTQVLLGIIDAGLRPSVEPAGLDAAWRIVKPYIAPFLDAEERQFIERNIARALGEHGRG